jgi:hypothetical protein
MEFWTIEVLDGSMMPASRWRDAYGQNLVEAAVTHGAQEWRWVSRAWGEILEVAFRDEADWLRFRATPAVQAALDGVPDPVNGLLIYAGRGGSSAAGVPRHPRPAPMSGAAELPEPEELDPFPELGSVPESLYPPLSDQGLPAPLGTEPGLSRADDFRPNATSSPCATPTRHSC